MRICLVVQDRHAGHSVITELARELTAKGHHVETWIPERQPVNLVKLEVAHELYVARCRSTAGLAALAVLDARGARIVNRFRAIVFSSQKATVSATLRARRIPHPESFVVERPDQLRRVGRSLLPLVIKPLLGEAGEGVRLLGRIEDLDGLPAEPVFAQHYVPNQGYDHKAYVVGDRVRMVRKPSPLHGGAWAPAEERVPDEVQRLAVTIGRLFGLELFGVDLLFGPDGWQVLEVNDFPSFEGLEGGIEQIASYVLRAGRETEPRLAEVF